MTIPFGRKAFDGENHHEDFLYPCIVSICNNIFATFILMPTDNIFITHFLMNSFKSNGMHSKEDFELQINIKNPQGKLFIICHHSHKS